MSERVLANRVADWRKLKALVLDSVSSPITKRVYNLGLDEFFSWYGSGAERRLHQGDRQRLARCAETPRARERFDHRADHSSAHAGSGGRGYRPKTSAHTAIQRVSKAILE